MKELVRVISKKRDDHARMKEELRSRIIASRSSTAIETLALAAVEAAVPAAIPSYATRVPLQ